MDNEAVYEIAYVTPSGKHGRKQARQSRVPKVCEALLQRGYHDVRVSFYPLIPGVDPIL